MINWTLDEEEILYTNVHRHLADPVFRIKAYGLRLKDSDLFICLISAFVVWALISSLGLGQVALFTIFTLDPFAMFFTLVVMAYGISFLRGIRPEATPEETLRSGGEPTRYSPVLRRKDRTWSPSPLRPVR
jgi:hypothetical protein